VHPDLFCPSQDELAFTEEHWRSRLRGANAATFGLFAGTEIVGLSTVVREPNARQAELDADCVGGAHHFFEKIAAAFEDLADVERALIARLGLIFLVEEGHHDDRRGD